MEGRGSARDTGGNQRRKSKWARLFVRTTNNKFQQLQFICDDESVKSKICKDTQLGEFLLAPNATQKSRSPILTQAIHGHDTHPINYEVKKTGYYCVWTFQYSGAPYKGVVEFRNAYGELPAAQIPKLPFYGALTIVYALVGCFWGFLYVQNRHDILPVQNYITAIIVFLIIEQLMTWGFYDYQNRHGNNLGNKVLMIITAILNAGRNSFSFFLLLIVCMGYGVVRQSLGKTMLYVRALGATHFVFGVIYGVASLTVTPDSAGPLVLLVVMPLAATLTAFYVWTLNSLSATMKDLLERKQSVKALMYKRLWWCILGSIIVIFVFFFFNSFTFASRSDPDFVPNNWKARWFVLDGWLNLVYLFDICFVAYLWRPTVNNRRFAMSDEVRPCLQATICHPANTDPRLRRTTTVALRLRHSAIPLQKTMTKSKVDHVRTAIVVAATATIPNLYHRCRLNHLTTGRRWTGKPSSQWATRTSSVTMTAHGIRANARG
jgi:hypothetical protein